MNIPNSLKREFSRIMAAQKEATLSSNSTNAIYLLGVLKGVEWQNMVTNADMTDAGFQIATDNIINFLENHDKKPQSNIIQVN